jgi:hypothetical protein
MVLSGSFPSWTRIVGLATARRLCLAPLGWFTPGRVIVVAIVAIVAIGRRSSVASFVDRVTRARAPRAPTTRWDG